MELQEIFLTALDYDSKEQRSTFLDSVCAECRDTRDQVEAMLKHAHRLDSFLETPAYATTAAQEILFASGAGLQTQLGSQFQLVSRLGEGGMGTVWLAQQTHPIERTVAIKLLKPGLDSRNVLARFETERQTLAKLQHPNIAAILDAGTTLDGRPFFVMEHYDGLNIADYCKSKNLGLRERLILFVEICRAIAYVHRMGILHRDIKPSNVLIVEYDGTAIPKVIDFGIAKAIGQDLPHGTWQSTPGGLIGTPEYMAPELLSGTPSTANHQTDVYGLGALLYHLLVGTPPFGKMQADRSGVLNYLKRVEQTEPVPPSRAIAKRLGRTANNGPPESELAQSPAIASGEDGSLRDIDRIVMHALERDPARRYPEVALLQADLQSYLNGKPVKARPPSTWRRWQAWKRRHPLAAAGAIGSLAVLLSGTCGLWWGMRQGIFAVPDRPAQEATAQRFEQEAVSATDRAERLEQAYIQDLRDAVKQATERLSRGTPDGQEAERETLRNLAKRWAALAESVGSDERRRSVLAEANFRSGQIQGTLGETAPAIEKLEQAAALYQALSEEMKTSPNLVVQQIENLAELGRRHFEQGDPAAALEEFGRAISSAEKVSLTGSAQEELLHALSDLYTDRAKILVGKGMPQDALTSASLALERLAELEQLTPNDYRVDEKVISAHSGRAFVHGALGQFDQEFAELKRGKERLAILKNRNPDSEYFERLLGTNHLQLGMVLQRMQKYDQAAEELGQAIAIFQKRVETYPAVPHYRERLAAAVNSLGVTRFLSGEVDQGVADCQRSVDLWKALADDHPSMPGYRKGEAQVEMNLGVMLSNAKRYEEAEATLRLGIESGQQLTESFPDRVDFALAYARGFTILAGVCNLRGDSDLAIATIDESLEHFRRFAERFLDSIDLREGFATAHLTQGDLLVSREQWQEAWEAYEAAHRLVEQLPLQATGAPAPRDLATVRLLCAELLRQLGRPDDRLIWLERAETSLRQRAELNPTDNSLTERLEKVSGEIAQARREAGPLGEP